MSGTNGLATAVELLGGMGDLGGELDLTPDLFEPEGLPRLPMPAAKRGTPGAKGGRPKGSRNKSTEAYRQYVLSRYPSPLIALCEMYSRTSAQLAKDFGLYKYHEGRPVFDDNGNHVLETGTAAAMQLKAMEAALPYLHQRLPQAVEIKTETRGLMLIGHLDLGQQQGGNGLALPLAPREQNQKVSDGDPAQSHADQSHDADNTLTTKDNPNDAS